MTERELAVQFYRELLDLAVADGERDSYERLLFDLFDRGAQFGIDAERQQRAGLVEKKLAETQRLFDEAVRLSHSRGSELDQQKRELALVREQVEFLARVETKLREDLAVARAELEGLHLQMVDARVAS